MKTGINIKKIYSLVLMLVFMFSVVPRIHIHELVADHIDITFQQSADGKVFSKAGINCHFEKFAAESPFLIDWSFGGTVIFLVQETKPFPPLHDHYFSFILDKDNKGPPAI